jgi:hypothetical protein
MLKASLLYVALLFSFAVSGQTANPAAGFTYTRLTAYSQQFHDAFSFSANLGALAAQQRFSAGVYSERRFLLKELATYSAAVVLPLPAGNVGFGGNYFGGPLYHDASAGLAFGRNLGSNLAVGVQFNYHSIGTAGYGNASTLSADAGLIFRITSQCSAGVQVYNPAGVSWGKDGAEKLPAVYTTGIGYDVSKQVFIGAEAEKTEGQPVSINAGLHYAFAEKLTARAGIRSGPSVYYLGLGIQLKDFRFDATASVHPYLGLTPGLMLLYSPKE